MPPRKSDVTAAKASADDKSSPSPHTGDDKPKKRKGISVDDNTLPKTIITRLAKGVLPQGTQIQKDAVTAFTRSTTVFVNYLASAANDITKGHGKKTITPQDVVEALNVIEFPGMKERLEVELQKFNAKQAEKKDKAKARSSLAGNTTAADTTADPMSEDDVAPTRPSKRQRKSLANDTKDDEESGGAATDANILDEGSQDEDDAEAEGEGEEEGEEASGSEEEEEEESGKEEADDLMEDGVEDIDRDDRMGDDDDDEDLDDDSD
ncbi:hypothetical protein TWF696_002384 [Orbilia brochopaga]|uniref:DNA polymerase epsilon subunit D n=1 Tax=Orbilia brochopaga TaxID=3140254 RepID=A0AAV9U441_9PEZI